MEEPCLLTMYPSPPSEVHLPGYGNGPTPLANLQRNSVLSHTAPIEFVDFIGSFILLPMTFYFQASLKSFKRKKTSICNLLTFSAAIIFCLFFCISHTHVKSDMMAWSLPTLGANIWSQSLSRFMSYLLGCLPFPIDLLVISPKRQMDILHTWLSFISLHPLIMKLLSDGILERWPFIEKVALLHDWLKSTLRDSDN